jgi:hypothetical protein
MSLAQYLVFCAVQKGVVQAMVQMLSDLQKPVSERGGSGRGEENAGARTPRAAAAGLLASPKPAGAATHAGAGRHTISLTTAYGDLVAAEEVADADYGAALHRFYEEAVPRASAVVVLDGVMHTRNSFLEFVRQFNDWAARQRETHAPA